MPVQNMDVAEIFDTYADLLEIEDANPFRVRAYRNAARTVAQLPRDLAEMIRAGDDLTELSGIGKDLAGKIQEIVKTGRLFDLEEMERESADLRELMKIPNLGPKRVKALNRELGIDSPEALKRAAENRQIRKLDGFGKKTEKQLLEAAAQYEGREKRIKLLEAEQRAEPLVDYLKQGQGIEKIAVAGSFRRRRETVGDLDILAACKQGAAVMDRFTAYEDVQKVVSRGDTRSTVVLRSGLQVDLRVLPRESFGAALHYFTGSKRHNIAVRRLGIKKGYKINEYGVFQGDERIAGKQEQEVFEAVGMAYVPPELREDRGEIQAAREGSLPELIVQTDLRGDLHSHTRETDGHHSLEEMAREARQMGYAYLAVTDHSRRVTMANGLDAGRLAAHIEAIDRLNETLEGIVLLKGIEVDILEDGTLDLDDDILKELDLTVCSVHYNRNLSREKQTERIIRAMDNPHFNILGHPTGRLINEREAFAVDLEKLMDAAVKRGCFMEINAHPDRLDLADRYCRMARDKHLKLAIATDAHSTTDLSLIRFGIDQARRGWLTRDDVLNTRSWEDLRRLLSR